MTKRTNPDQNCLQNDAICGGSKPQTTSPSAENPYPLPPPIRKTALFFRSHISHGFESYGPVLQSGDEFRESGVEEQNLSSLC